MDNQQFDKFIEVMSQKQTDHDMLVEIRTVVRLNHDSYEAEKKETAERLGDIKKTALAAHKRIDYIYTGVMIAVAGLVISVIVALMNHKAL